MRKTKKQVDVTTFLLNAEEVQLALQRYLWNEHEEIMAMPDSRDSKVRIETYRRGETQPVELAHINVVVEYLGRTETVTPFKEEKEAKREAAKQEKKSG